MPCKRQNIYHSEAKKLPIQKAIAIKISILTTIDKCIILKDKSKEKS